MNDKVRDLVRKISGKILSNDNIESNKIRLNNEVDNDFINNVYLDDEGKELARAISKQVSKNVKNEINIVKKSSRPLIIIKNILIFIIILAILFFVLYINNTLNQLTAGVQLNDEFMLFKDNNINYFNDSDFKNAIVNKAKKESLLIINEQELFLSSTITQQEFIDLGIFDRNEMVLYNGNAQYTVDLTDLDSDKINVDNKKHIITITVPSVKLHKVIFNPKNTLFSDLDKGLLSLDSIKMDSNNYENFKDDAIKQLEKKANEEVYLYRASEYAKYSLRDLFEETVSSINETYKVKIEFE